MSWLTSLPDYVITDRNEYYEIRPNPTDADKIQARKRLVFVGEYRGLTYQTAVNNSNPIAEANLIMSFQVVPIGGGGYNLVYTKDYIIGDWIDIETGTQFTEGPD
jgi:hypothetical protein